MKQPSVYIMASQRNGTLYTGVTSDLNRRAFEHRQGLNPGFAKRYGCKLFVWYEYYERMGDAIAREKQIKAGSRRKKLKLIETFNPDWHGMMAQTPEDNSNPIPKFTGWKTKPIFTHLLLLKSAVLPSLANSPPFKIAYAI